MDVNALRAAQAPLKAHYREDPSAALTPLHATATFEGDGVTATVQGWAGPRPRGAARRDRWRRQRRLLR